MLKTSNFKLWLVLGILMGMPLLKIKIWDFELVLYNVLLIIIILKKIIKKEKKIVLYKYKFSMYAFLITLIISSILSINITNKEWFLYSLRAAIKLSVLMMLIVLPLRDDEIRKNRRDFLKGLKIAAIINFIWMLLQFIIWNTQKISINQVVFGMNIVTEMKGQSLVLTGMSNERADTVLLFAIAIAMSDKFLLSLCFFIGTVMTGSRVGILMVLIVYFYKAILWLRIKKINLNKLIKILFVLCFISLVGMMGYFFNTDLVFRLANKFVYLMVRLSRIFKGGNDYISVGIDPHLLYYLWIPKVLGKIPVIQILFGCGTRASGWVYAVYCNYYGISIPWTIECDFVSILFGNGVIGLITYYWTLVKAFLVNKEQEMKAIIVVIFFGGFMYQFHTSTTSLMIVILLMSKQNNNHKG